MDLRTKYTASISSTQKELRLRQRIFQVLPKIKYVRKKEKLKQLSNELIATVSISHIPSKEVQTNHSKSYLGNGIQSSDIHCVDEYSVTHTVFDEDMVNLELDKLIHKLKIHPQLVERHFNNLK